MSRMDESSTPIGEALKQLRVRQNLSQRAAASQAGMSYVYWNRIEREKSSPTVEILDRIRVAFGVDVYMMASKMRSEADK